LQNNGEAVNRRWRHWAQQIVKADAMSPEMLTSLWREVLEFDPILREYVAEPVSVGGSAVVVAGSGKDKFKTFNVSTAASILATAAGATVVKGVSRSVSAVSGAADVLDALGVPITSSPAKVSEALERDGISFISYAAFCPSYAGRYDGVFPFLSPFSFMMPIAVLAVEARSFVYGLANTNVLLATEAIQSARPDIKSGIVVATQLATNEIMDEQAGYGATYTARLDRGHVDVFCGIHPEPTERWRTAVAHQDNHGDNARLLVDSIMPDGCGACAELVERNAALILAASQWGMLNENDALAQVRNARLAGRAARLLTHLQTRKEEEF
jgi:anthranilate phosphoribosyltransferase